MKRKIAGLLCLTMFLGLVGCGKATPTVMKPTAQESDEEKTEESEDEDQEDRDNGDEEEDQQSAVDVSLDSIYATKYEYGVSDLFLNSDEGFYDSLARASVDAQIEIAGDNDPAYVLDTIKKESVIWNQKIDYTWDRLRNENYREKDLEKLEAVISAWEKYDEDIAFLSNTLYGYNGAVPGSMYTEMLPEHTMFDYEIICGGFLGWEYKLFGDNSFETKNLSSDADLSQVSFKEFDAETFLMEYSEEYEEVFTIYQNKCFQIMDMQLVYDYCRDLCKELDELSGQKLGLEKCVDDYYELVYAMRAFEKTMISGYWADKIANARMLIMDLELYTAKYLLGGTEEMAWADRDDFDAFLKDGAKAQTPDGESASLIEILDRGITDTMVFTYVDVDKDGEDELFMRDYFDSYVVKKTGDSFKVIFEGSGHDYPVSAEGFTGVLYDYMETDNYHEIFKFTEFNEDGSIKSTTVASWYDVNQNGEMEDIDAYYTDDDCTVEVPKDEWMELAADILEHRVSKIEWAWLE